MDWHRDHARGSHQPLRHAVADGKLLVAGGTNTVIDAGVVLASAELHDPATGSWTATESMPVARGGYTVTLLGDGTALVAGGNGTGGYLPSTEVYDQGSGI